MTRGAPRRERGSISVMVLGFTLVAVLLMLLVVMATSAYLTRRSLVSYADGAAVTAAQAVSAAGVYEQGITDSVPLDAGVAARSAAAYVAGAGLAGEFEQFRLVDVQLTRAGTVRVVLAAVSPVPFAQVITGSYAGGVPVQVEATAEAVLG